MQKIKINELNPAEYNPRKIDDKELAKLKKSIEEFGLVEPLVVNKDMTVIGGHQRLKVCKELGWEEINCIVVDLDKTKEKLLNLALNRISGEWDEEKLGLIFKDMDLDIADLSGFDADEISKSLDFNIEPEEDDFDTDGEYDAIKEPESKLGEVYELGEHRLMCGDATKLEDVEKLMNSNKADMVFTDPPYGVNYEGKTKDKFTIKNDENTDIFDKAIENYITKEGASFYVCCPPGNNFKDFIISFEKKCYQSQTIIWVKHCMVMGHGDYHYKHEQILYGWEKNGKHKFYGDRKNTTVWEFDRPMASRLHPTMKPIAMIAKAINNSSKGEDIVLDLFGGSGSTLIACEQTNRKCYMMELDPKYCDVIRKRYEQYIDK